MPLPFAWIDISGGTGNVRLLLMTAADACVTCQVSADLTPETQSRVGVQFTFFKIFGLLPIKAPDSAKGQLDTTFVDEDLRISRGDKGMHAALTKMSAATCTASVSIAVFPMLKSVAAVVVHDAHIIQLLLMCAYCA